MTALADGIVVNAAVLSHGFAVQNEISRRGSYAARLDPGGVIAVRNEADVHAVRLVCGRQAELFRQSAHLGLFVRRKRQQKGVYLLRRQTAEHVALVIFRLPAVNGAVFRFGIMPRGNVPCPESARFVQKSAELDRRVAENAGIRRLAAEIRLGKRGADIFLHRLTTVGNRKRNGERSGSLARGVRPREAVIEIQPVNLKPRFAQQMRGHGGIHAAGETENDLIHGGAPSGSRRRS